MTLSDLSVVRFNVPVTPLNWPFTFEIIMCRTLNSAWEWTGSMFQVVVATVTSGAVVVIILNPPVIQMIVITNRFRIYRTLISVLNTRHLALILSIPSGLAKATLSAALFYLGVLGVLGGESVSVG